MCITYVHVNTKKIKKRGGGKRKRANHGEAVYRKRGRKDEINMK